MMNFITTYFLDLKVIEGGVQLNLSIASLVAVLWFATWRIKRMFRKS